MLVAKLTEEYEQLSIENVPEPEVGRGEVLVDVEVASLCGTDLHYSQGRLLPDTLPVVSGHEGAGVVVDVGDDVEGLSEGDHVVINYVLSCGDCVPCANGHDTRCRRRRDVSVDVPGTFSERMAVPARAAIPVAEDVPLEWGSIAACAVSTAYHAVTRSGLSNGETALVFGAGGVGLHAILWASFFGAARVVAVDPAQEKLAAAREYGADVTIDPGRADVLEEVAAVTDDLGVDVAIECSGATVAMEQAIDAVDGDAKIAESGTVVAVGRQSEPFEATMEQLMEGQIRVSADHNRNELREILDLLETGRVDLSKSITHRVSLPEINDGLDLLARAHGGGEDALDERVGRIVVEMP